MTSIDLCSLSIRASALRGASEHVVDRLRRVGGQGVRVLVELAGHALRLVDPCERDLQPLGILLAVEALEPRIRSAQRAPSRLEMAARFPEVNAVDLQARIEHRSAPF